MKNPLSSSPFVKRQQTTKSDEHKNLRCYSCYPRKEPQEREGERAKSSSFLVSSSPRTMMAGVVGANDVVELSSSQGWSTSLGVPHGSLLKQLHHVQLNNYLLCVAGPTCC